ncbi:MAG TPA: CHAT domain-containing protein, partial [Anaerolineales bacterium]|nr:CHAT domain-containing protein [Anaerolineales bacterium]
MTSIKVSGYRDESLKEIGYGDSFGGVTVSDAVHFSTDRASSAPQLIKDLKPDDVVELIYEEGIHRWVKVSDLEKDFKDHVSRSSGESDVIEIPGRLPTGDTSRGAVAAALNGLRVLKYDPMKGLARDVVERLDKKIMPEPGLYRFDKSLDSHGPDLPSLKVKGDATVLLFIHGTFSKTSGGFGSLQKGVWLDLQKKYGDRIYGYDHYTLSKSPVENALDLVKRLPNKVKLHIVTHSRGGLVGELLCRGGRKNGEEPFDKDDKALLAENKKVLEALTELSKLLKSKSISVERFVRVAAPARGTALASDRIDRFLEVFINVVSRFLPPGASFPVSVITDLLLQFKKQSANPEAMPGLASMNPDSNFIKMINRPDVKVNTDLTVIAGDVEKTSLAGRLAVFFTDIYYREEHDLVVNTPAMYGGPVRDDKKGRFFFDKGPEVNHCNYFNNKTTAEIMRDALTLPATSLESRGFKPISLALKQPVPAIDLNGRSVKKRGSLPQPVVYVLPGIMGTHLSINGDRIWLNALNLARGGMARLFFGDTRHKIEPEALMGLSYGKLVDFLSATHEVIPFPYDWRKSILDEADRFANALEAKLKQTNQPIRIIAHSMGGLVTRTMIGLRPDVWEEIAKRDGARFIMLGTPNKGAYKIPRVVFGQDRTFRTLAAVDIKHTADKLNEIIVGFPGFLQLLPMDEDGIWDFLEPNTWNKFPQADKTRWIAPSKDNLEEVRKFRKVLESSTSKIRDWDPIIYVAGTAKDSPVGVEIQEKDGRREIVFRGTDQGDGTVPWASGILPSMKRERIFYMDAAHGDLANHKPSFAAIYELLANGTTSQLETSPLRFSRGLGDNYVLRSDTVEIYPTQQELESAILDTTPDTHRAAPIVKPVKVSVFHGNLSFCENVVAVGHYDGDGLYSAERDLDHHLDGRLTVRHKLGRYPGREGTVDVVLNTTGRKPGGGIIVGLGNAGELTPRKLSASFANAMREYGVKLVEQRMEGDGEIKIASLLIGTGSTGLTVRNAVDALLNGITRANKSFAQMTVDGYNVRIAEVQFVEVYKDQAIQAVRALEPLKDNVEFTVDLTLQTMQGGWRRIAYDEPPGWWKRITVRAAGEKSASLVFSIPADRARMEESPLEVQRRNMDRLIAQAVKYPTWNKDLATALFELMIPNGLKASFKDLSSVLFVVDKESAHYPWELLYDSRAEEGDPLAIQAGLIRQFSTPNYRERVSDVRNTNVMVVGNPKNTTAEFSDLPGAEQEGRLVAEKFKDQGFDVQDAIKTDSSEIMSKMFSKDYRVIHLAGHGVFEHEFKASADAEPETFTGMVLGDGVFLTASEISKKTNIPELVFINCCHLGKISSDGTEDRTPAYNKLAASLSEELINMGVKAVVAAGWAVDDAAALTFAEAFYDQLFLGRSFGEAVLQARKITYEMHKERTNTWGAYQCYGDPEYQLVPRADESQRRGGISFVDVEEAALKVNQQFERAKTASAQNIEIIRGDLIAIVEGIQKVHPQWLDNARLLAALGEAFSEAHMFKEAVEYYDRAVLNGGAAAS